MPRGYQGRRLQPTLPQIRAVKNKKQNSYVRFVNIYVTTAGALITDTMSWQT